LKLNITQNALLGQQQRILILPPLHQLQTILYQNTSVIAAMNQAEKKSINLQTSNVIRKQQSVVDIFPTGVRTRQSCSNALSLAVTRITPGLIIFAPIKRRSATS
jgi:hypothetical protein